MLRTTARVAFDERRLAHVSPRISGRVAAVLAELGDEVAAGKRLATLDSIELGEAKAGYLAARAEESLARKTLKREEHLFGAKIASEQAVSQARATRDKALAYLRSAEEKLRLYGLPKEEIRKVRYGDPEASVFPLTAPIAGRIVDKHLVIGELVSPEDKVFTVADLSQLWIWIDVYERDLARVHIDDTVRVATQAYPERTFEGRVAYVSARIEPDTRAARARIDIPNADGVLKPGMFAEVVLTDPHGEAEREAVAVPPSAVLRDGAGYVAFVKAGERRYERRGLRIGARTEALVEILEGLAPGEEVVVEGGFLLKSEVAKDEMGGGHSH
jgi:cobalt-zinc-cadmium efflux system membrane fusion protein